MMKTTLTDKGNFVAYREFPEQGRCVVSAPHSTPRAALESLRLMLVRNGDVAGDEENE